MATSTRGPKRLTSYLAGPPAHSQAALAEACGVKQQTISRWKNGEDSPLEFETMIRLEQATGGFVRVEDWLSPQAARALRSRAAAVPALPPKVA